MALRAPSCVFSLLICFSALADETNAPRKGIALVLSGGGARGSAHVGVLKVIEEKRIPVDFIAGTSMGAIIGGLYSSGLSPEEIERILGSTDWSDLFSDRPSRQHLSFRRKQEDLDSLWKIEMGWKKGLTFPASLIAGDKLMFYLRKVTLHTHGVSSFDDLPIPFRAVATDIESGDAVVLGKGDLPEALRASMAIPGVFGAEDIDGRLLVDGFLSQNLPVSVARERGTGVIIAVDVGSLLSKRTELTSVFAFANQTLTMMSRKNTKEQIALLRQGDILIEPKLGEMAGLDFSHTADAVALGAEAAQQALAKFTGSLSEQEYAAWRAAKRRPLTETLKIDSVRVEGSGAVPNRTIEKRAGVRLGQEMKVDEVRHALDRIYDIGAFDVVDFELAKTNGQSELLIKPRERATGRVHIRAGLKLFSDLDGDSDFNFLTSITAMELNRFGAEWKNQVQFGRTTRVFSEWYQPLTYGRGIFVAPYGEFLQDRVDAIDADGSLIRGKFRTFDGGIDAGAQLGNIGELRIGPAWGYTRIYELRGLTLSADEKRITQAGGRIRLTLDQFDNVDFPRHGYLGGLEFFASREELGADLNYSLVNGSWFQAVTFGENTLLGGLSFGAKLGPDLPFYENFSVGGFLNLSGYPFEGLADQYVGIGRLIFYRRVVRMDNFLVNGIYLGGSAETGGVWHDADDIDGRNLIFAGSVFVGAATMFGPLYFAYGYAEGGNQAFYFYLGRGF